MEIGDAVRSREIVRRDLVERCREHPAWLLDRMRCVDSTTGETFEFHMLDEGAPWYWQRELLDEWVEHPKNIDLKARQLGITWLAGAFGVWTMLFTPGSHVLVMSVKEDEAVKVLNRMWDMLHSLPDWLRNGAVVIKPVGGARPTTEIQLRFPDGRVSLVRGLSSTPAAGQGMTAALVILDEFSRQPYAEETWGGILPTTAAGGRVIVISTGNGISNPLGGGNFFHHLWVNADTLGIRKRFLAWDLHPLRDEEWYQRDAMAITPSAKRAEAYPRNEYEAFILTGRPFFDDEAIVYYRDRVREPVFRCDFRPIGSGRARVRRTDTGQISVWEPPMEGYKYAIGADIATGRGQDFSCAYVVNLSTAQLVAEFHGKVDYDLYAEQLHYLGRWYNTALIAPETGGGYGDTVISELRNGRRDRPAYPRLYRHVMGSRPDLPLAKVFGFPMNSKTRPKVINQLEAHLRERSFDYLPSGLLAEAGTFVFRETSPSPRAQDGCNDDRVMAAAVAMELYGVFGHKPEREQRLREAKANRVKVRRKTMYPWQKVA